MGIGSILYYLMWPIVGMIFLLFWFFKGVALIMEVGVDFARGLHEEIKEI